MKKTELRQLIREEIETLFENDNSLNEGPHSRLADYGRFTEAVRDVRKELAKTMYGALEQGQDISKISSQLTDFKRWIDGLDRALQNQAKRTAR